MPDQFLSDLRKAIAAGRGQLEYLRDLGFEELAVACSAPVKAPGAETLAAIRADLGDCQRCPLGKTRQTLVFGVGNPHARLVLVGEAPGREEDETGEPFVGEAGRLLDRMLFAMGLQRDEVYICNVLKCRPPNNRDPEALEVATCEPFLVRQLAAIQPKVILALGRFAVQTLLQSKTPIGRLRGSWHEYHGIPLMPTYHPAYLLRNPLGKREVWSDIKQVAKRLESC
jgi:DNA polymerase